MRLHVGIAAFQQGLQAWDPTSRHASSCCYKAPLQICRIVSGSGSWGPTQERSCHATLAASEHQAPWLGSSSQMRILHVSAKEVLQAAADDRSSLATVAGTPMSLCALLRNLGVCVGGFGPHSYVIPKCSSSYPSRTQLCWQHLKMR